MAKFTSHNFYSVSAQFAQIFLRYELSSHSLSLFCLLTRHWSPLLGFQKQTSQRDVLSEVKCWTHNGYSGEKIASLVWWGHAYSIPYSLFRASLTSISSVLTIRLHEKLDKKPAAFSVYTTFLNANGHDMTDEIERKHHPIVERGLKHLPSKLNTYKNN